ncbi:MAG: lantibiotic dehydratase [Acidobacteriota bacterium]
METKGGVIEGPILLRVAGLSADRLAQLGGDEVEGSCQELLRRAEAQGSLREQIVEQLYGAVSGSPPERRRFLLAVKRDCFNGRSLGRHTRHDLWPEVCELTEGRAEALVEAEAEGRKLEAQLEALVSEVRRREHRVLEDVLDHPPFLKGLALSSPTAAEKRGRLVGRDPETYGRRQRLLAGTLLRYLSRAAMKLSPFSSFTHLALGEVGGGQTDVGVPIHFDGGPWRGRSLVRLRTFVLEQMMELLKRNEAFLGGWRASLNGTRREVEPGKLQFLRPNHWVLDPESRTFQSRIDGWARVGVTGPRVQQVFRCLEGGSKSYRGLLDQLLGDLSAEDAQGLVQSLAGAGVVVLSPPWPSHADHLEKAVLAYVEGLPGDRRLNELADRLRDLLDAEAGLSSAEDPVGALARLHRSIEGVWTAAEEVGEPGFDLEREKVRRILYEDTALLGPERDGEGAGIVRLPAAQAGALLRDLDPWIRLADTFRTQWDFLVTLDASMEAWFPGRRDVPFLEVLEASKPLWKQYIQFLRQPKPSSEAPPTFDPEGLPALRALGDSRDLLWRGLLDLVGEGGEREVRLCPEAVAELLATHPNLASRNPLRAASLFLQPADPEGDRWVLNQLSQGGGRFGSRFSALFGADGAGYFQDFLRSSTRRVDGETVELLDITRPEADTLNIHGVQTPRVLELPGQTWDLPAQRRVQIRDLQVRRSGEGGLPVLTDAEGRRLVPAYLGGVGYGFMPVVSKLIAQFGLGPMTPRDLPLKLRDLPLTRGLEHPRLVLGRVVLQRRMWDCESAHLAALLDAGSVTKALVALTEWRAEGSIPRRVFLEENIAAAGKPGRRKPQFLDLTSPLCLSVLEGALKGEGPVVRLVEALPDLGDLPRPEGGASRAVEVLLDTWAIGRKGGS